MSNFSEEEIVIKLLKSKKILLAKSKTEDLIKKFPNNSKFYNILGMILYEEKQYMNSIKNYKKGH